MGRLRALGADGEIDVAVEDLEQPKHLAESIRLRG